MMRLVWTCGWRALRSRLRGERVVILFLVAALVACGSTPSPSPTQTSSVFTDASALRPLALAPGNYWLGITGSVIPTDPRGPECTVVGRLPQGGSSLTMLVQLVPDRSGWAATSPSGFGDLSLRFQPSDRGLPQGQPVAGAIRGLGYDTPVDHRPSSLQVTIGGVAGPDGELRGIGATGAFLYGEITGQSVIRDETGAVSCGLLHWTLQPER